MPQVVHIVMGGGIVIAAYRGDKPHLAMHHARCITGCAVLSFDIEAIPIALRALLAVEVLSSLPPDIVEDMRIDWENDDDVTPVQRARDRSELDEP